MLSRSALVVFSHSALVVLSNSALVVLSLLAAVVLSQANVNSREAIYFGISCINYL